MITCDVKLTEHEAKLLQWLEANTYRDIDRIDRQTEREFDITIRGVQHGYHTPNWHTRFISWLPLAIIKEAQWPSYARLGDFPCIVRAGDWSGIRDSSDDAVWKMFRRALKELDIL